MRVLLLELRLAWANLLEHRQRSLLLGAAIGSVGALFVLLSGLASGISQTLFDSATTLASGHLNVGGFYKVGAGQAFPLVERSREVAEVVRRVPGVVNVIERGRGAGKLVADTATIEAALVGVDIATEPDLRRRLVTTQGKLDDLAQPGSLLLFEAQAKNLKVRVGDAVTIVSQTPRGVSNTLDCHVAAIAKDIGMLSAFTVLLPNASLQRLLALRPDVAGVLEVRVDAARLANLAATADDLRTALVRSGHLLLAPEARPFFDKLEGVARAGWTGQRLDVSTWEDEMSFVSWSFTALNAFGTLLLCVLLGVTVAGIMNSLWIATRERTREIGTLRALGMQRASVARLFVLEASMLGLLAATVGAALGLATSVAVNLAGVRVPLSLQLFLMRDTLVLALDPSSLPGAVILMTLSAGLAAAYPAWRAAHLRPANAMVHLT